MEVTRTAFLRDARDKIDLLATAVDYAAGGFNSRVHPHSCPNVRAADQKLQNLLHWYDELERSNRESIPACEVADFTEFLDREIAGAQNFLAGVSEKNSDRIWWHNLLLVIAIIAATAAIKVLVF